jgi:hypothetical protein
MVYCATAGTMVRPVPPHALQRKLEHRQLYAPANSAGSSQPLPPQSLQGSWTFPAPLQFLQINGSLTLTSVAPPVPAS